MESTVAWSATVDTTDSKDRDNMRVGIRGVGKQEKAEHITDTKIKMLFADDNIYGNVFVLSDMHCTHAGKSRVVQHKVVYD